MSTRAIGHTQYSGGYKLLQEQIVTSGVSTVEFNFPSPVVWNSGNSMYEGDRYDVICMRFYNVHAASNHVWFQFAMSSNTSGGYGTSGMHQIVCSDRSEQKWWQGGTSNSDNRRNHTSATDMDKLVLASTGVSGDSTSCVAGYLNLYDIWDSDFQKFYHGEVFGDTDKLNSSSANERSQQFWPNGYYGIDSRLRRIRFNFSSGNIDAGIFRMYGLKQNR